MILQWFDHVGLRSAGRALLLTAGCVMAAAAESPVTEARDRMEQEVKAGSRNVVEERVNSLVRRMTLDEKISYLAGTGFDFEGRFDRRNPAAATAGDSCLSDDRCIAGQQAD